MGTLQLVVVALAGLAAGVVNTVVGSGTLITFPTLLALGVAPVTANVSNCLGLVFGGVSGAWGYRAELREQRPALRALMPMSLVGAVIGAVLLLRLPESAFDAVVPVLIGLSVLLVVAQPRLSARLAARSAVRAARPGPALRAGTLAAGVYGGYFGAAQGVLLMGLLGTLLAGSLQELNGVKNVLALVANAVASVTFLVVARDHLDPAVAAAIAVGSGVGGVIGARVGRRLAPTALRALIVTIGLLAILRSVLT